VKRHRCKPAEKIVAFHHACGVCGKEIEPVHCRLCDGTGHEYGSTHTQRPCRMCKGTGAAAWRPVEEAQP
jgi:DnaJ-class molecular chaperone